MIVTHSKIGTTYWFATIKEMEEFHEAIQKEAMKDIEESIQGVGESIDMTLSEPYSTLDKEILDKVLNDIFKKEL